MNLPAKNYLQNSPGSVFDETLVTYECGDNDEYLTPAGTPHHVASTLHRYLSSLSHNQLLQQQHELQTNISYHPVSSADAQTTDSLRNQWSLDPLPHVINHDQWQGVQQGIIQRIDALNLFIEDIHADQHILNDNVLPEKLLTKLSQQYLSSRRSTPNDHPPANNDKLVWASTDVIRDSEGNYRVSGNNLHNPGNVAYMLANRQLLKNASSTPFADSASFADSSVLPIDDITTHLRDSLTALSPNNTARIGLLINGSDSPRYAQFSYLARQLGALLVESRDLFISSAEGFLYADTIDQSQRLDVVLICSDDPNNDMCAHDPHALMDVPGLLSCWNDGKVALANAPQTRLASNPMVLSYMPELINYYLNQKMILPAITSYRCDDDHALAYVLDHMDELVITGSNDKGKISSFKAGLASREEKQRMFKRINDQPYNFVASPVPTMSTAPTVSNNGLQPQSVTVTAYSVHGTEPYVTNGGVTRLGAGTNTTATDSTRSQHTKDTWVIEC